MFKNVDFFSQCRKLLATLFLISMPYLGRANTQRCNYCIPIGCNSVTTHYCLVVRNAAAQGAVIKRDCIQTKDEMNRYVVGSFPSLPKWCAVGHNNTFVCACVHPSKLQYKGRPKYEEKDNSIKLKPTLKTENPNLLSFSTTTQTTISRTSNSSTNKSGTSPQPYVDEWYLKPENRKVDEAKVNFTENELYPSKGSIKTVNVTTITEDPLLKRRIENFRTLEARKKLDDLKKRNKINGVRRIYFNSFLYCLVVYELVTL